MSVFERKDKPSTPVPTTEPVVHEEPVLVPVSTDEPMLQPSVQPSDSSAFEHLGEEVEQAASEAEEAPQTTALPDEYWIERQAPDQVTPGTRTVNDEEKPSSAGGTYHSTSHYDEFGRLIGQTHRTAHGRPHDHPTPHHHRRDPKTGQQLKSPWSNTRTWDGLFGNEP